MKENKYTARSTVEAGLMSVIVFIILMITTYVPLIGMAGFFVLPVPITLLYLRHNKVVAILSVIVSTILISMFYNPLLAIASAVLYGVSGLSLGFCISRGFKSTLTLVITSIANLVGIIINLYLTVLLVTNVSLVQMIQQMIDQMKMAGDIYKNAGIDMSTNPAYQQIQQLNVNTVLFMIPAVLITCTVIISLLNYVIAKKMLKRFGHKFDPIRNFMNWYLDNRVGALIISIVCVGIILKSRGFMIGDYILTSSMTVLQFTLIIIGTSIVFYYLKTKLNVKNGIAIAICIFIAFSGVSSIAFYIGLIDLVFDIRGLDPNSLGNALRKKFVKK
ncbi:membrane protein [Clostridium zeae]|uniref:Membrane protein n=1 Tax=Clostridium zeae TaxID=2759022 RepID=A0ABQ1EFA2_9CLOT|nr:YybS family protein [Clostridium zeae]GFZ33351.1 membrane protein [Clostridium zeae]